MDGALVAGADVGAGVGEERGEEAGVSVACRGVQARATDRVPAPRAGSERGRGALSAPRPYWSGPFCAAAGRAGRAAPPPPPRTKRTRRVPHPVLIGHAGMAGPHRAAGLAPRLRRSSTILRSPAATWGRGAAVSVGAKALGPKVAAGGSGCLLASPPLVLSGHAASHTPY